MTHSEAARAEHAAFEALTAGTINQAAYDVVRVAFDKARGHKKLPPQFAWFAADD